MKNTFVCECVCVLCQMKTKRNKMLWCLNHSDAKALWIVWVGGTVFDDEKCARWHAFLQTCFSTTNIFVFGCLPVSSQFLFFFLVWLGSSISCSVCIFGQIQFCHIQHAFYRISLNFTINIFNLFRNISTGAFCFYQNALSHNYT